MLSISSSISCLEHNLIMVHVSNKSRNEMEFHCLFVAFALFKSAADGVGENATIDWL